jgi:hypothetical protein
MLFLPFAGFAQLPSVDDVSVQYKGFAGMSPEKIHHFPNMGIADTEVNVRQNDGFNVRFYRCGQGRGGLQRSIYQMNFA